MRDRKFVLKCNILPEFDAHKVENSYPLSEHVKRPEQLLIFPRDTVHLESECVISENNVPILCTNYPIHGGAFKRDAFHPVCSTRNIHRIWVANIEIAHPGSYQFYLDYQGVQSKRVNFVVEPKLQFKGINENLYLPLNGIVCMTVITKCLGNWKRWKKLFLSIKKMNYNMIHFTPPHILGWSDSSYSIYDQLMLTDLLLPEKKNPKYDAVMKSSKRDKEAYKQNKLTSIVRDMAQNFGVFSITDVVWNHTASNSPWLRDHPNSGYTLQNSPHLRPAYCVDLSLKRFSHFLAHNNTQIKTIEDVDMILNEYKLVLDQLHLEDFFTINLETTLSDFVTSYEKTCQNIIPEHDVDEFYENKCDEDHDHHPFQTLFTPKCIYTTHKRNACRVHRKCLLEIFTPSQFSGAISIDEIKSSITRAVERYNQDAKNMIVEDSKIILNSLRNNLQYHRIELHNPDVTISNTLVAPYFVTLSSPYTYKSYSPHPHHQQGEQSEEISVPDILSVSIDNISLNRPPEEEELRVHSNILDQTKTREEKVKKFEESVNQFIDEVFHTPSRFEDPNHFWKDIDGEDDITLAHSGWVWGMKASEDFANKNSKVYFTRELIVWSDSVKLNYGNTPADNKWLWDYMKSYTCMLAKIFHGFRIDNCHSTPLHVARFMIDAARKIQPELYVTAELFTDDAVMDSIYCSELGISSLIREAMQVQTPFELSEKVHYYSNGLTHSLGSLVNPHVDYPSEEEGSELQPFDELEEISITGSVARSLFFDCTHDNKTPYEKRTIYDALSNSACVCFSNCAAGSVFGYDQLVPHRIDVVKEKRVYTTSLIPKEMIPSLHRYESLHEIDTLSPSTVMEHCKSVFNKLHLYLMEMGFSEIHVHEESDYIVITRFNPRTYQSVYLITHTAFTSKSFHLVHRRALPTFTFTGEFKEEILSAFTHPIKINFSPDPYHINGLPQFLEIPTTPIYRVDIHKKAIQLLQFPMGSVLSFATELSSNQKKALSTISSLELSLSSIMGDLSFVDLNYFMFTCNDEERSVNPKSGVYNIPGYGDLSYCGIAGVHYLFEKIKHTNNLGHPLCQNLREGNWLLNYLLDRISDFSPSIYEMFLWMTNYVTQIKKFPDFLQPKLVCNFINLLFTTCQNLALSKMSSFVQTYKNNFLVQTLSLNSLILCGIIPSSPISRDESIAATSPSLSAGLPHFSTGYMRNWGRDTFISLRGLLLIPGRHDDAKQIIFSYAACLRHGLIPNLLDGGRNPRYNARDATWWFLQAVQDYCDLALENDSNAIFEFLVHTKFPRYYEAYTLYYDPKMNLQAGDGEHQQIMTSLAEIIQEIMQMHIDGIEFVEHNAGKQIDSFMKQEGFHVSIRVDAETGFIYGGNEWNCGTWMDKMGSSEKAKNAGIPATPRDGADIEIIGLLKSTTRWLASLYASNAFPYAGVKQMSYRKWDDLIADSFERYFYVPLNPADDVHYVITSNIVNRRGIYKDVVGSTKPWHDYQFRPNLVVTLAIAPELFNREHARTALKLVEEALEGKLGLKTLDPNDWSYSPYYSLDDSDNYKTACGFNYHQGPEWVWLYGYYLRALINFSEDMDKGFLVLSKLSNHEHHLRKSMWGGLPELTNKDGEICHASCTVQAWSAATILDALHTLYSSL